MIGVGSSKVGLYRGSFGHCSNNHFLQLPYLDHPAE
jgi:hypothetical protein